MFEDVVTEIIDVVLVEDIRPIEIALPIIVAFFAFLVRFAVSRRWVSIGSFLIDIFAAIFSGLMVSLVISDIELAERTKWFIVAIAAMVGPDILLGILHTASLFSDSPLTFTLRIIRIVMKKPLSKEELEEMMEWEKSIRKNGHPNKNNEEKHPDEKP